jgi:predicted amidohydrolase YtcJ
LRLGISTDNGLAPHRTDATVTFGLKGRTVVPGLNDSHL